jgi:hypothetical protein
MKLFELFNHDPWVYVETTSNFNNSISRILHGGISSGLNVVSHEKEPKLFIVKGKRQPVVRQLASIEWKEFNDGDVFVLDAVQHVYVWTGKQSNRLEKLQGAKVRLR